jgi:hypothetical protein
MFTLNRIASLLRLGAAQREGQAAPRPIILPIEQAIQMADSLRAKLLARNLPISRATALEYVATQLGHKDWRSAAALCTGASTGPGANLP